MELHEAWLEQEEENSTLMLTLYPNVSMRACYSGMSIFTQVGIWVIMMNLANIALVLIQNQKVYEPNTSNPP